LNSNQITLFWFITFFLVVFVSGFSSKTSNITLPTWWSNFNWFIDFNNFVFKAIQTYEYAISCQSDWKNLHHVRIWLYRRKSTLYLSRSHIGKSFGVMCKFSSSLFRKLMCLIKDFNTNGKARYVWLIFFSKKIIGVEQHRVIY
jgi:hypothetical protein